MILCKSWVTKLKIICDKCCFFSFGDSSTSSSSMDSFNFSFLRTVYCLLRIDKHKNMKKTSRRFHYDFRFWKKKSVTVSIRRYFSLIWRNISVYLDISCSGRFVGLKCVANWRLKPSRWGNKWNWFKKAIRMDSITVWNSQLLLILSSDLNFVK